MKSYVCPLCGKEFPLRARQKTVKCGDHTLHVSESEGVLTVQVKMLAEARKEEKCA